MTEFESLGLEPRLLKALAQQGYTTPTPIQTQAIPHVLAGKDLLGIAQTGTGKTASFALPILQRLMTHARTPSPKSPRALVLSPTRELAAQIADSFKAYGRYMNFSVTTVFGGVSEGPQKQSMAGGVEVLVATPGRLLDLVNQRAVDLSKTEIFVLDEADRMLDMGFITDIRRLVRHLPSERQNLFFSATMPQEIGSLASDLLRHPVNVSVTPQSTTVERIAQRVIHVTAGDKRALLINLLRTDPSMTRVLVFTRTKHGADKIVRALDAAGIYSSAIHGNKSQSQRVHTLNSFRSGRAPVLVATDIAARGIDVDGISHVVNFDLPHVPESYVHRIGRTARAGAEGIAIAFCDREERPLLKDIEKVTRQQIPASEWRSNEQTRESALPVLTHDQKQDFRKQREGQGEGRPHAERRNDGPRPHRKGPRPQADAAGPSLDRPSVNVEARESGVQHRNGKPPHRLGKPFQSRPFHGKPRSGDQPRTERSAENRGERRPEHAGAPRSEHRGGPRTENRGAPRSEHRGEQRTEHRGAPRTENRGAPRSEHRGERRPEQAGAPRSEHRGAPRPENRGAPRSEHRPAQGDRPHQGKPRQDRPGNGPSRGDRPAQPHGANRFSKGAPRSDRPQNGPARPERSGPGNGRSRPPQGRFAG